MDVRKGVDMICPHCGGTLYYTHHNALCKIARALEPGSPDPEITPCNTDSCLELHCNTCGYEQS